MCVIDVRSQSKYVIGRSGNREIELVSTSIIKGVLKNVSVKIMRIKMLVFVNFLLDDVYSH